MYFSEKMPMGSIPSTKKQIKKRKKGKGKHDLELYEAKLVCELIIIGAGVNVKD